MSIFVSVAAYRDPDLNHTLLDCLARARYPADLHFGLVWQHGDGEAPPPDLAPARLSLVKVPWRDSQGACWARAQAMALWDGEDFFFQIDSHHRFVQDWDVRLLAQAERSGADLPLLTTYAPDFTPGLPPPADPAPTAMRYASFTRDGVALFDKTARPEWTGLLRDGPLRGGPVRARALSAHLLFTLGRFVADVPYDPDLYFIGEEVTLAVRAFTWGYDLFHPSVHVMWHQNPRRTTPCHWDDHAGAARLDSASLDRARRFLTDPWTGPFGCGTARTFAEFERYAGVDFRRRSISPAARRGDEPPPPPSPIPGGGGLREWPVSCVLNRDDLPPAALDRPAFWYVAFHDRDGTEIARLDADRHELHGLLSAPGPRIVLDRRVRSHRAPVRWTVWPTDRRRTWLRPVSGGLDPEPNPPWPAT